MTQFVITTVNWMCVLIIVYSWQLCCLVILQEARHEMRQRMWTFYDDIVHVLQNTKLSNAAEVYKNFIVIKSDLQLNLKIMSEFTFAKNTQESVDGDVIWHGLMSV